MTTTIKQPDPAPEWLAALGKVAQIRSLPAGTTVFHPGMNCTRYLLVREGRVRVFVSTASGREATLYRVGHGDTCVLTTSCLLSGDAYPAHAVTETPVEVQIVPAAAFQDLLDRFEGFRRFVFASLGHRLTTMIQRFEALTDRAVLPRLARHLLDACGTSGTVSGTHQQLASELGTAREVISRRLKDLEADGYVRLERGRIELTDPAALERIALDPTM
jgi:CRP/FNR family transcriptional regulator